MDRAGRPIVEKPQATVQAVVLARSPAGALYRLEIRLRLRPDADLVGEALHKAQQSIVARTERLRDFEVFSIGGGFIATFH